VATVADVTTLDPRRGTPRRFDARRAGPAASPGGPGASPGSAPLSPSDAPVGARPPAHHGTATGGPGHLPGTEGTDATAGTGGTAGGRAPRVAALAGLTALTGYLYLADPDRGGAYPLCPSQTLLGLDCPLCGGLRGTHALLHGRVGEALDHNLLLPGVLAVLTVMLGLWLLPLVGRPARRLPVPRWLGMAALGLLVAFGVARNLPIDALQYLASDA
jgi:hypothetical protein